MCSKIPYDTKADALADAKFIETQRKRYSKKLGKTAKSGKKQTPYQCPACGQWHLTTSKR